MHRFLRSGVVLAFVLGWGVASVRAQSNNAEELRDDVPAFAIAPVGKVEGEFFALTMEAGASQSVTAALVNAAESAFHARTFAADAFTVVNGGMGVKDEGDGRSGVTTWIDYPSETLTIDPRSTVERDIAVRVPDETPPGQYLTSIVLQTAAPIPVSGTASFDQILRKSVAVFITVPGPLSPKLEVGNITLRQDEVSNSLVVEVMNSGNALLRPAGAVELRDELGLPVVSAPVQMGPVYAGDATTIEFAFQAPLPEGHYTLQLDLSDTSLESAVSVTMPITVHAPATPVPLASVAFDDVTMSAMPSVDDLQYLEIALRIANSGEQITGARLVLHVERDGDVFEDFIVASSLALPTGVTDIAQRYIPANGWSAGRHVFTVSLEAVDPSNGVIVLLASVLIDGTIDVP